MLLSRAWVPSRKILLCQAPSNARSLSRKLQVPSLEPGPPDSVLAEKQQLHKGICAMLGKYLTGAAREIAKNSGARQCPCAGWTVSSI